jgi:hypothetical protein
MNLRAESNVLPGGASRLLSQSSEKVRDFTFRRNAKPGVNVRGSAGRQQKTKSPNRSVAA